MKAQQSIITVGLVSLTLAACAVAPAPTDALLTDEAETTASEVPPTQTEPPPTVEATPEPTDSPPPTETPTPEAVSFSSCDAVGNDQMEAIIGALSVEPQNFDSVGEGFGYFGGCIYESGAAFVAISFGPLMGGDADAYWAYLMAEPDLQLAGEMTVESYWKQRDEVNGSLYAMRGDIVLEVLVSSSAAREMAIQIAQIALVRIPEGGGR